MLEFFIMHSFKKVLLCSAFVVLPFVALASWFFTFEGEWKVTSIKVQYYVRHPMHDSEGSSNKASGKIQCGKSSCRIDMELPVLTFTSKSDDRDEDLRKLFNTHKITVAKVQGDGAIDDKSFKCDCVVSLNGKTKRQMIELSLDKKSRQEFHFKGSFPVSLKEFSIPAPSLIGVAIEDVVKINIEGQVQKQ